MAGPLFPGRPRSRVARNFVKYNAENLTANVNLADEVTENIKRGWHCFYELFGLSDEDSDFEGFENNNEEVLKTTATDAVPSSMEELAAPTLLHTLNSKDCSQSDSNRNRIVQACLSSSNSYRLCEDSIAKVSEVLEEPTLTGTLGLSEEEGSRKEVNLSGSESKKAEAIMNQVNKKPQAMSSSQASSDSRNPQIKTNVSAPNEKQPKKSCSASKTKALAMIFGSCKSTILYPDHRDNANSLAVKTKPLSVNTNANDKESIKEAPEKCSLKPVSYSVNKNGKQYSSALKQPMCNMVKNTMQTPKHVLKNQGNTSNTTIDVPLNDSKLNSTDTTLVSSENILDDAQSKCANREDVNTEEKQEVLQTILVEVDKVLSESIDKTKDKAGPIFENSVISECDKELNIIDSDLNSKPQSIDETNVLLNSETLTALLPVSDPPNLTSKLNVEMEENTEKTKIPEPGSEVVVLESEHSPKVSDSSNLTSKLNVEMEENTEKIEIPEIASEIVVLESEHSPKVSDFSNLTSKLNIEMKENTEKIEIPEIESEIEVIGSEHFLKGADVLPNHPNLEVETKEPTTNKFGHETSKVVDLGSKKLDLGYKHYQKRKDSFGSTNRINRSQSNSPDLVVNKKTGKETIVVILEEDMTLANVPTHSSHVAKKRYLQFVQNPKPLEGYSPITSVYGERKLKGNDASLNSQNSETNTASHLFKKGCFQFGQTPKPLKTYSPITSRERKPKESDVSLSSQNSTNTVLQQKFPIHVDTSLLKPQDKVLRQKKNVAPIFSILKESEALEPTETSMLQRKSPTQMGTSLLKPQGMVLRQTKNVETIFSTSKESEALEPTETSICELGTKASLQEMSKSHNTVPHNSNVTQNAGNIQKPCGTSLATPETIVNPKGKDASQNIQACELSSKAGLQEKSKSCNTVPHNSNVTQNAGNIHKPCGTSLATPETIVNPKGNDASQNIQACELGSKADLQEKSSNTVPHNSNATQNVGHIQKPCETSLANPETFVTPKGHNASQNIQACELSSKAADLQEESKSSNTVPHNSNETQNAGNIQIPCGTSLATPETFVNPKGKDANQNIQGADVPPNRPNLNVETKKPTLIFEKETSWVSDLGFQRLDLGYKYYQRVLQRKYSSQTSTNVLKPQDTVVNKKKKLAPNPLSTVKESLALQPSETSTCELNSKAVMKVNSEANETSTCNKNSSLLADSTLLGNNLTSNIQDKVPSQDSKGETCVAPTEIEASILKSQDEGANKDTVIETALSPIQENNIVLGSLQTHRKDPFSSTNRINRSQSHSPDLLINQKTGKEPIVAILEEDAKLAPVQTPLSDPSNLTSRLNVETKENPEKKTEITEQKTEITEQRSESVVLESEHSLKGADVTHHHHPNLEAETNKPISKKFEQESLKVPNLDAKRMDLGYQYYQKSKNSFGSTNQINRSLPNSQNQVVIQKSGNETIVVILEEDTTLAHAQPQSSQPSNKGYLQFVQTPKPLEAYCSNTSVSRGRKLTENSVSLSSQYSEKNTDKLTRPSRSTYVPSEISNQRSSSSSSYNHTWSSGNSSVLNETSSKMPFFGRSSSVSCKDTWPFRNPSVPNETSNKMPSLSRTDSSSYKHTLPSRNSPVLNETSNKMPLLSRSDSTTYKHTLPPRNSPVPNETSNKMLSLSRSDSTTYKHTLPPRNSPVPNETSNNRSTLSKNVFSSDKPTVSSRDTSVLNVTSNKRPSSSSSNAVLYWALDTPIIKPTSVSNATTILNKYAMQSQKQVLPLETNCVRSSTKATSSQEYNGVIEPILENVNMDNDHELLESVNSNMDTKSIQNIEFNKERPKNEELIGNVPSKETLQISSLTSYEHKTFKLPEVRGRTLLGERRVRCKKCVGCLAEDCGKCIYCLDKKQADGQNLTQRTCMFCRCVQPQLKLVAVCNSQGDKHVENRKLLPTRRPRGSRRRKKPLSICDLASGNDCSGDGNGPGLHVTSSNASQVSSSSVSPQQLPVQFLPGNPLSVKHKAIKNDCPLLANYWQKLSTKELLDFGFAVVSSQHVPAQTLCYVCGSSGLDEILFCSVCCEPYHPYCTMEPNPVDPRFTNSWCCQRCRTCVICRKSGSISELTVCSVCPLLYHSHCVVERYHSHESPDSNDWVCPECVVCRGCGASLKSPLTTHPDLDTCLCNGCRLVFDSGGQCPVCRRLCSKGSGKIQLIQCSGCKTWIHSRCVGISGDIYELLSCLPDPVPYTCSQCTDCHPPKWLKFLQEDLKASYHMVLSELREACKYHSKKYKDLLKSEQAVIQYTIDEKCKIKSIEILLDDDSPLADTVRECDVVLPDLKELLGKDVVLSPNTLIQVPISMEAFALPGPEIHKELADMLLNIKSGIVAGQYKSIVRFCNDIIEVLDSKTCQRFGSEFKSLKVKFIQQLQRLYPWIQLSKQKSSPSDKDDNDSADHCYSLNFIPKLQSKEVFDLQKLRPGVEYVDNRKCVLCGLIGDAKSTECGRLIPMGRDDWIHVNCALWSAEVIENLDGLLTNVYCAVSRGRLMKCEECQQVGATVGCFVKFCPANYHFSCAHKADAYFQIDHRVFCHNHHDRLSKGPIPEADFSVNRCVIVDQNDNLYKCSKKSWQFGLFSKALRISFGSILIENLGYLSAISDRTDMLLPINYCSKRMFWSVKDPTVQVNYTFRILKGRRNEINSAEAEEDNRTIAHQDKDSNLDKDTSLTSLHDIGHSIISLLKNSCDSLAEMIRQSHSFLECNHINVDEDPFENAFELHNQGFCYCDNTENAVSGLCMNLKDNQMDLEVCDVVNELLVKTKMNEEIECTHLDTELIQKLKYYFCNSLPFQGTDKEISYGDCDNFELMFHSRSCQTAPLANTSHILKADHLDSTLVGDDSTDLATCERRHSCNIQSQDYTSKDILSDVKMTLDNVLNNCCSDCAERSTVLNQEANDSCEQEKQVYNNHFARTKKRFQTINRPKKETNNPKLNGTTALNGTRFKRPRPKTVSIQNGTILDKRKQKTIPSLANELDQSFKNNIKQNGVILTGSEESLNMDVASFSEKFSPNTNSEGIISLLPNLNNGQSTIARELDLPSDLFECYKCSRIYLTGDDFKKHERLCIYISFLSSLNKNRNRYGGEDLISESSECKAELVDKYIQTNCELIKFHTEISVPVTNEHDISQFDNVPDKNKRNATIPNYEDDTHASTASCHPIVIKRAAIDDEQAFSEPPPKRHNVSPTFELDEEPAFSEPPPKRRNVSTTFEIDEEPAFSEPPPKRRNVSPTFETDEEPAFSEPPPKRSNVSPTFERSDSQNSERNDYDAGSRMDTDCGEKSSIDLTVNGLSESLEELNSICNKSEIFNFPYDTLVIPQTCSEDQEVVPALHENSSINDNSLSSILSQCIGANSNQTLSYLGSFKISENDILNWNDPVLSSTLDSLVFNIPEIGQQIELSHVQDTQKSSSTHLDGLPKPVSPVQNAKNLANVTPDSHCLQEHKTLFPYDHVTSVNNDIAQDSTAEVHNDTNDRRTKVDCVNKNIVLSKETSELCINDKAENISFCVNQDSSLSSKTSVTSVKRKYGLRDCIKGSPLLNGILRNRQCLSYLQHKRKRPENKLPRRSTTHCSQCLTKNGACSAPTQPSHTVFEISNDDGFCVRSTCINVAWKSVLQRIQEARREANLAHLNFKEEDLDALTVMGLKNKVVTYFVEQLPGAEKCLKYKFKYHKPLHPRSILDNPSGCIRTEKFNGIQITFDSFSFLASRHRHPPMHNPNTEDHRSSTLDLPLAERFRLLRDSSKTSVGVYKSRIHGLGLFCKRAFEAGEMIIEYAGEVIRSVLCDKREKYYESKGIGCYMFRIDEKDVVDATKYGTAARFINHSCEPNCFSRVIPLEGKKHIVIFAMTRIWPGEELTYDYKFPFEEVKIPCTCGSKKCRKYLN